MNLHFVNNLSFGLQFSESAKKYFSEQLDKLSNNLNFENKDIFIENLNKLKNIKTLDDNDKLYMYEQNDRIQLVFQENNEFSNQSSTCCYGKRFTYKFDK